MCPQEHKGYAVKPLSVINKKAIALKRYGVALMFLRAHGRKSMPVCLVLMFLCPFVLMFSALAARYGVSPYVSLATRTLVRGQPRSGLLCILCKLMSLMFSALSG